MLFSLVLSFFILVFIILLSGFFAGAEIGLMSLNRYRLRHLVKKNNKKAIRVNNLLSRPDKLLSVVLIGNTVANIVASTLATLIGDRLFGTTGVAVATVILSLVVLVVSEMMPKTLAAMYPEKVAFRVALPLQFLQNMMAPLVVLVSWITNGALRIFGVRIDNVAREALTADELRSVVNEAGCLLPSQHKSMLIGVLDLEEATVEDIMIPTGDIIGIDLERPWQEVLFQLETAQHTRLPLYKGSIDQLIGMIHVRSILSMALEGNLDMDNLIAMADVPYFVPEGTLLNLQIVNFQREKKRSCFVVDEYGDLQGLVTMEDILEEVVGEFTTNIADICKDILHEPEGSYLVDASITLRHLKRMLGWDLPSMGPRTLSGLIIEYLGYIPPSDCCLTIENFHIEILKVHDNMIKSVRMSPRK
jgi:Mg2+/Co2+ transporter CorB